MRSGPARAAVADTTRKVRAELAETIGVPEVRLVESRVESGLPDSAIAGSLSEPAARDAGRALVKLGCSRSDAETRLRQAEVDLKSMGTEGWLREALRA